MTTTAALASEIPATDVSCGDVIGRGGIGIVSAASVPTAGCEPPLVLKRFHDGAQVDVAALRAMVDWRRGLSQSDRQRLDQRATWPLSVVVEGTTVIGFLMRRVPGAFEAGLRLPSGRRSNALCEAQYLFATPERMRRLHLDDPSAQTRIALVRDLAKALAFLHGRGIVVGDVSSRNVLWNGDRANILLVDCDSMLLGGVGSPCPAVVTVDWDDPAQPKMFAGSSDVYKFGLFVVRALGREFQGRDAAVADPHLDATGRWLLRLSLSGTPDERPSARAWERWAVSQRAADSASASQTGKPQRD